MTDAAKDMGFSKTYFVIERVFKDLFRLRKGFQGPITAYRKNFQGLTPPKKVVSRTNSIPKRVFKGLFIPKGVFKDLFYP